MPNRDNPGVIAPPPLIFLACILAGYLLERLAPIVTTEHRGVILAGAVLAAAGIAVLIVALVQFRAARTAIEPWKPTTTIIRSGLYGFSRNPIYVGMAMVQAGLGLALHSVWIVAALAPALLLIHFGVVRREERYLEAKFGNAYRDYKAAVRRWL